MEFLDNTPVWMEWLMPIVAIIAQCLIKLKGIPHDQLNWTTWRKDNGWAFYWTMVVLAIVLCLVPADTPHFNVLTSFLTGPALFTTIKALIKKREDGTRPQKGWWRKMKRKINDFNQ